MTPSTSEPLAELPSDWATVLARTGTDDLLLSIAEFVSDQRRSGPVYPIAPDVLRAFELTPFPAVRAVIVGQDPYHREGQAHGLAFSVPDGFRQPPSLRNIFIELDRECGIPPPSTGSLESWARRGVLLLNRILTVGAKAGSHRGHGWEAFTTAVIRSVNDKEGPVAFFLWGRAAQSVEPLIDSSRHVVVKAGHPSPLSVRYFRGRAGFSRVNRELVARAAEPIDWSLP